MHGIEIDFTRAPAALDSLSSGPVGFFVGRGKRGRDGGEQGGGRKKIPNRDIQDIQTH